MAKTSSKSSSSSSKSSSSSSKSSSSSSKSSSSSSKSSSSSSKSSSLGSSIKSALTSAVKSVASKVVSNAAANLATKAVTSNSNKNNTTSTANKSSANYVSSKNNGNGTTTYTKANGDSWTENSKGQVVSKVVNGAGMSVAPTSSTSSSKTSSTSSSTNKSTPTTTSKTSTTVKSSAANNILLPKNNVLQTFINNTSGANKTAATKSSSSKASTASSKSPTMSSTNKSTSSKASTNSSAKSSLVNLTKAVLSNTTQGRAVNAVMNSVKSALNKTTTPKSSTSSTNKSTTYDYTKQNANGAAVKAKGSDGKIYYTDNTVYDPKTGKTTDSKGNVVKDKNQATQVSEGVARGAANERANASTTGNSTTYNPTATPTTTTKVTTDRKNQEAANTVIKNNTDTKTGETGVKSNSLKTDSASYDKESGVVTYIAPNGKKYEIARDGDGDWAFTSQGGKDKGKQVNVTDDDGNIVNDIRDVVLYIKQNNKSDGIDRQSNVDNRDAIKGGKIEGTYVAPSGKEYDIVEGTGANDGKIGFVNTKGQVEYFDNWAAAKNKIDINNPTTNKDTAKNQIAEDIKDRGYMDENGDARTGIDALDNQNLDLDNDRSEREEALVEIFDALLQRQERAESESEDTYNRKNTILNECFGDLQNYQREMEDALDDLKEKTKLVQDNDRMRWARQRAAQLAAQGYLTSEQVQQVANYSIADYNKELKAAADEAAQKLSQMRMDILDKKEQYMQAIRQNQYNNESERQTQLNYGNNVFNTLLQWFENTAGAYDQYYTTLRQNNLSMNTQNELGYDSLIRQNDVQNIISDRNVLNALSNTTQRRQYILSQITDENLKPYAEQEINRLINSGQFLNRTGTIEQQKTELARQVSQVASAAKQLQYQQQLNLAK